MIALKLLQSRAMMVEFWMGETLVRLPHHTQTGWTMQVGKVRLICRPDFAHFTVLKTLCPSPVCRYVQHMLEWGGGGEGLAAVPGTAACATTASRNPHVLRQGLHTACECLFDATNPACTTGVQ
jgi:hypothetical protein